MCESPYLSHLIVLWKVCFHMLDLCVFFVVVDLAVAPPSVTKLHLVAKMNDLEVKLCEQENDFAHIAIKGTHIFHCTIEFTAEFLIAYHGHVNVYSVLSNTIYVHSNLPSFEKIAKIHI